MEDMEHRVFIALPASQAAKAAVIEAQAHIKRYNPYHKITWVEANQAHITLFFLGERNEAEIEKIKEVMRQTVEGGKTNPPIFALSKLDAFPSKRKPNILVMALRSSAEADKLYTKLGDRLIKQNLWRPEKGKSWRPHLTVGRNKTPDPIVGLTKISVEETAWQADKIMLIESTLTSDGPVYQTLAEYNIK